MTKIFNRVSNKSKRQSLRVNQVMDNIDSVFSDLLERIKELSPNLSLSKREEYQN